jgi:hypothetical protein
VSPPDWLPDLFTLSGSDGNGERYIEDLYEAYCRTYLGNRRSLLGMRVSYASAPLVAGKSRTFWHLITSGKIEQERVPDIRRCERILWPAAIVEHAAHEEVASWRSDREGPPSILLAVDDFRYLVVMRPRGEYVLLWTAYHFEHYNQRARLRSEYERCEKC